MAKTAEVLRWQWQLELLLSSMVKAVIFCVWEALVMEIPRGARYGTLALRVAAELVSWGMHELAVEVAPVFEAWPCEDLPWNQGLSLWDLP